MSNEELKSQANTYTGVVGFFDILGYQNLLEKNEPEDIAQKVLPILTGLNASVSAEMTKLGEVFRQMAESSMKDSIVKLHKQIVDSIQWLIFSDTILLAMPMEDNTKTPPYWVTFFLACISIQTQMFRSGLPLRGAISFGKYFLKDTCFAGKSIIEAHQLCYQLELAACVLTEKVSREINKLKGDMRDTFFFNYLVPTKEGEMHLDTLAAHYLVPSGKNIRSTIMECFWGHNKDIPISASAKVSNTEQWLTFLKMKEKKNT